MKDRGLPGRGVDAGRLGRSLRLRECRDGKENRGWKCEFQSLFKDVPGYRAVPFTILDEKNAPSGKGARSMEIDSECAS
jgi:hypothetical protein